MTQNWAMISMIFIIAFIYHYYQIYIKGCRNLIISILPANEIRFIFFDIMSPLYFYSRYLPFIYILSKRHVLVLFLYNIKRFMTYLSSYKHFKTGWKNLNTLWYNENRESRDINLNENEKNSQPMFRQYCDRLLGVINRFL